MRKATSDKLFKFCLRAFVATNGGAKKVGATPEQNEKFFVSAEKRKSLQSVRELPERWFYNKNMIYLIFIIDKSLRNRKIGE